MSVCQKSGRMPGRCSEPPTKEYLDEGLARTAGLVDKYHPQLVWFERWIEQPAFQPYLQHFAAFYYNRGAQWQKGGAINYKNESFPATAAVFNVESRGAPTTAEDRTGCARRRVARSPASARSRSSSP